MFDSHCHLTDDRFADDLPAVLDRAWDAGLAGIVTIASDADDADVAWQLACSDPRIRSTAGVHPHKAQDATEADLARITRMLARPEVVAVGETGLDYYYDNSPRDTQRTLFEWHLRAAADAGKPIVVHSRSADEDTAAMIREAGGVTGVLHCFSGNEALMDTALDAGWFISFAGMVSFRNFAGADLLRAVPDDRLLLETDSPYLAPVPFRGRRNEPAFVAATCAAAAALRGVAAEAMGQLSVRNARRFYGLDTGRSGGP
ncbi:MAG TPA: TatD family hydrolase [Longimicrobiales bacterium]|nr:TatD family hydrolase [Longimicrobiales bacterium]